MELAPCEGTLDGKMLQAERVSIRTEVLLLQKLYPKESVLKNTIMQSEDASLSSESLDFIRLGQCLACTVVMRIMLQVYSSPSPSFRVL